MAGKTKLLALALVLASSAGVVSGAGDASAASARAVRLDGRAALDRHQPVVGAIVVVKPEDGAAALFLSSTDEKGTFRLEDLPEGVYRVEIGRDGLDSIVKEHVELRFPFRAVVEVTMRRSAGSSTSVSPRDGGGEPAGTGKTVRLTGRAVARGGGPLPEVRIRLVRVDRTEDPRSALSTAEGRFEVADLPAGRWSVSLLAPGYLPLRTEVDISTDASIAATFVMQPADYLPTPIDLMPPEVPIAPDGK